MARLNIVDKILDNQIVRERTPGNQLAGLGLIAIETDIEQCGVYDVLGRHIPREHARALNQHSCAENGRSQHAISIVSVHAVGKSGSRCQALTPRGGGGGHNLLLTPVHGTTASHVCGSLMLTPATYPGCPFSPCRKESTGAPRLDPRPPSALPGGGGQCSDEDGRADCVAPAAAARAGAGAQSREGTPAPLPADRQTSGRIRRARREGPSARSSIARGQGTRVRIASSVSDVAGLRRRWRRDLHPTRGKCFFRQFHVRGMQRVFFVYDLGCYVSGVCCQGSSRRIP